MDMVGTWILRLNNGISDIIRHDMLPILKYVGIIDYITAYIAFALAVLTHDRPTMINLLWRITLLYHHLVKYLHFLIHSLGSHKFHILSK